MSYYSKMDSPIGEILLVSDGTSLIRVSMVGEWPEPGHRTMDRQKYAAEIKPDWVEKKNVPSLEKAVEQLQSYFAGKRSDFDLPLSLQGTEFQKRVWRELTRIPYGETISYAELARRVGNAKASRAVGLANGKNPLAIVVPCHRVIGANGTLTGYGGGLERKRVLLELEQGLFRR